MTADLKKGHARDRFAQQSSTKTSAQHKRFAYRRSAGEWRIDISEPTAARAETYDLRRWATLGRLGELLFDGFASHSKRQKRESTRRSDLENLENGFLQYVRENTEANEHDAPDHTQLTAVAIEKFVAWLDKRRSPRTGKPLSVETKRHYLGAVRKVREASRENLAVVGVTCEFPRGPWKNSASGQKTKPLTQEEHRRLFILAANAVVATIGTVEPMLDRILPALDEQPAEHNDAWVTLVSALLAENLFVLPERAQLSKDSRRSIDQFGYRATQRVVAPQLNDLVPFILFMALMTGYNEQPLLSLRFDEIDPVSILGADITTLRPLKHRGLKPQRRSFVRTDEVLSPPNVLAFVEKWTSIVRRAAPAPCRDVLFIAANKWKRNRESAVIAFGEDVVKGRQVATAITNFLKGHFDRFIGTRVTRASFADLVDILSDGDLIAVKTLLGHTIPATTRKSYHSDAAIRRGEERLSLAMEQLQRAIATDAKVDPRRNNGPYDTSAATPGWICIDPYESPVLGEQAGRLCQAYGLCPGCPLGAPANDGAEALGRALQLLERMEEARMAMGIPYFHQQFGDAYKALREVHLPRLASDGNVCAAKRLSLNPLPPLH